MSGIPVEPGTVRIAVDLLGGDAAPAVVVGGALRAFRADPNLHLLLVGPPEVADGLLGMLPAGDRDRVRVRAVHNVVGMADSHVGATRTDTTVRAAVSAVAEGAADAVVSAGATGATVTAAVLGLGRWPDVRRPALVATLPAVAGPVVLLDVGGSLDAQPATLIRHATLGAAFAAMAHAIDAPRIGLLSVGTEAGKGDESRLAADRLLAELALPAGGRYVGLVEGYEACAGRYADVVVTDGFTGNVLLKGIEGAYVMAGVATNRAPRAAPLLGVNGTVVVCHGAARDEDIAAGIALAAHLRRRATAAAIATLLAEPAEVNQMTDTEVIA